MKILDGIIQGENSWHSARAKYPRTASLAPSIMGSSKKRSRNDAIRFLATGIDREFSQWVQDNLLDRGHLIESFAKPLAEKIIGKKLYPITAISDDEYLLASYDGLSADDEDAWECKSWNEKKAEEVRAGKVPDEDIWQVVQQLAIGAERCLYMVTDGTEEKTVYCWIVRNDIDGLIDELIAGWNQADNDVANYQHVEHTERPKAEVCTELPALFVHAKGEITTHNMDEFGHALTAKLAEVRAIALVTDQDFSNAKEAAKKFRETAKAIALSKEQMLAQTETIGETARQMDAWQKELNSTALQLEKDVEREDLAKKRLIVADASAAFAAHVAALEAEIKPIRMSVAQPDFAGEIKGKRNYASMQNAVDTALANGKIGADAQAKDYRAKLDWCKEHAAGMSMLFPDLQSLISMDIEGFKAIIQNRIAEHKREEQEREAAIRAKAEADAAAKLESERAAMQAEEKAKAEAAAQKTIDEAAAKAKAEQDAAAEQARKDEAKTAIPIAPVRTIDTPVKPVEKSAEIVHIGQSAKRPSDTDIIRAIIKEFGCTNGQACDWIIEIADNMKQAA